MEKEYLAGYSREMTVKVDISALAKLARLELSEEELTKLSGEISNILGFVEVIQKLDAPGEAKGTGLRNVVREDINPTEGGIYSEKLLSAAPARADRHIVVKQVVSRKPSQGGSTDRK